MTNKVKRSLIAGTVIAVLAGGGAAIAGAAGGDDDATEKPVTGQALDRASAAALEHTGGGSVTGSEAEDEEGAYEIEVTRDDGSQVDVHLNSDFQVIGDEDEDGEGDEGDEGR
jgi:uncharacterized membrane protein YkoI